MTLPSPEARSATTRVTRTFAFIDLCDFTDYGEAHGDDIASAINQEVKEAKGALITVIRQTSEAEKWDKSVLLETVLLATYASYVAMLEARNSVSRLRSHNAKANMPRKRVTHASPHASHA